MIDELMKPADDALPDMEGRNDFGEEGYSGPLPPVGDDPHRYVFRVFAASAPLGPVAGASVDDLRRALEGKELAKGTLSAPTSADHSPRRKES